LSVDVCVGQAVVEDFMAGDTGPRPLGQYDHFKSEKKNEKQSLEKKLDNDKMFEKKKLIY
jgi:hypothetical protein